VLVLALQRARNSCIYLPVYKSVQVTLP